MYQPKKNDAKMQEAILHIAREARSRGVANFGVVKLYKLLFLADFWSYGEWGEPITGSKYRHFAQGPVPVEFPAALRALKGAGRATEQEVHTGMPKPERRVVALDNNSVDALTSRDVSLLNHVLDEYGHHTGGELVRLTHDMRPWQYTPDGEVIAFEFAFAMSREPATVDDMRWAQRIIAERS